MFIDKVVIEVRSGKGGDGALTFLHEKYRPMGGPSGGNGGKGGSVFLKATNRITTLFNYRHSKTFIADNGENGANKLQYGKNAKDLILEVPLGTICYLEKNHRFLFDLSKEGDLFLIAKGGRGGRGNACFKSARNKAPKIAENGLPGETKRIILELKMIADVGIIGLPNVGKSTFISVVSNSKAKAGDYPFTTIVPNLGVVNLDNDSSFIIADMPGLIEGASEGKGLGNVFLRHIERTRVLIHMIDINSKNPLSDYHLIRTELEKYGMKLDLRPELICFSKVDDEESLEKFNKLKHEFNKKIYCISSLTNYGINKLLYDTKSILEKTPQFPVYEEDQDVIYYDLDSNKEIFKINKIKEGLFLITGERVERTFDLINITTEEGIMRLINYLNNIGVNEKLIELGAKNGDIVKLKSFEFEFFE